MEETRGPCGSSCVIKARPENAGHVPREQRRLGTSSREADCPYKGSPAATDPSSIHEINQLIFRLFRSCLLAVLLLPLQVLYQSSEAAQRQAAVSRAGRSARLLKKLFLKKNQKQTKGGRSLRNDHRSCSLRPPSDRRRHRGRKGDLPRGEPLCCTFPVGSSSRSATAVRGEGPHLYP